MCGKNKHIVGYRSSGAYKLSTFLSTYTLETKNKCAYKKECIFYHIYVFLERFLWISREFNFADFANKLFFSNSGRTYFRWFCGRKHQKSVVVIFSSEILGTTPIFSTNSLQTVFLQKLITIPHPIPFAQVPNIHSYFFIRTRKIVLSLVVLISHKYFSLQMFLFCSYSSYFYPFKLPSLYWPL